MPSRRARRERREMFGKTLGDLGDLGVEIVSGGLGPHPAWGRLWSARGKQRARSPFETPSAQRTPRNVRENAPRSRRARRFEIVSGGLGPHRARCRLWSARRKQRTRRRFETPSAQRTPRNFRENAPRSRRARRLKSSLAASAPTAPGGGSRARGGSRGRGDDLKRRARIGRREIFGKTLRDLGELGV